MSLKATGSYSGVVSSEGIQMLRAGSSRTTRVPCVSSDGSNAAKNICRITPTRAPMQVKPGETAMVASNNERDRNEIQRHRRIRRAHRPGSQRGAAAIWIEESGIVGTPVLITNTHSVGVVRDAVIAWMLANGGTEQAWGLPVVAETWDGYLNDLNGFHVTREHVFAALDGARGGAIAEGNVGGGTGMHTFEFKGGTGTSSRRVRVKGTGDYTVGVLVQSNFGRRWQLQVAGIPVGREWPEDAPFTAEYGPTNELGSIIVVVATDAPLLPTQLKRVASRASMGIARAGGIAGNGSGDIFLAFSTANAPAADASEGLQQMAFLPNDRLDGLFEATVLATEEAIINALVAARTMTGVDGHRLVAIDHPRLQEILRRHNRLEPVAAPAR